MQPKDYTKSTLQHTAVKSAAVAEKYINDTVNESKPIKRSSFLLTQWRVHMSEPHCWVE